MKSTKTLVRAALFAISLLFFQNPLEAQDTARIWRVETIDGNEFLGLILSRDDREIQLKTERLGVITIQMRDVKSLNPVNPGRMVGGQLWADNPQATRYFWAPNGYGLKKGEGYYQNVWVMFNQVSLGITDNFSMGLGVVPLFLFAGAPTPVWITPKVSIPITKDKFNVGAGALIGTIIGVEEASFGIAYGVATFGNRDRNLNIGIGYGFAGGEWATVPAISLGGMHRISKRTYLLTENYFIGAEGEYVVLLSAGGRTVWDKVSLDYGLFAPLASESITFFAMPWLGLVVPFGKR